MAIKLFISYRSVNSDQVDMLVSRLRSLKAADGVPLYEVWQDKHSIIPGRDWWQAIVQGIGECQVFLFMVSREAVKSENCLAELRYARQRNRLIVPIALEGEFDYNPKTGKHDLTYWGDIPAELNDSRTQFLFYEGTKFVGQLQSAVVHYAEWRDMPAPPPPDPRGNLDADNDDTALYIQACDYAGRLEFATAEPIFQRLANWHESLFRDEAHEWVLILRGYAQLMRLDASASTRHRLVAQWTLYAAQFPKDFIPTGIFDPKGFTTRFEKPSAPLVPAEVRTSPEPLPNPPRTRGGDRTESPSDSPVGGG